MEPGEGRERGIRKEKSLIQEKKNTAKRLPGSGNAEISRLKSYRSILESVNQSTNFICKAINHIYRQRFHKERTKLSRPGRHYNFGIPRCQTG